jgi:hypothetical protein
MEKKFVFEGQAKKFEAVALLGLREVQTIVRYLDGEP